MFRIKTLQEEVIPSLVNKFDQDVQLMKCVAQFMFAKMTLRSDSGTIREYLIIVKYQLPSEDVRNWVKFHLQQGVHVRSSLTVSWQEPRGPGLVS